MRTMLLARLPNGKEERTYQIGSSHSPRSSVHSNRRGQNLPPRGSATSGPTDVEVHMAKCQKIFFFAVEVPKGSCSNHPFGH